MTPLILTLHLRPAQRLDLSPLVPHLLAGKSANEIARIELQTTRVRVTVGDAFRLRMGDAQHVRIEGACDRLDQVGAGMSAGAIDVAGDVGIRAGRLMTGGRLMILEFGMPRVPGIRTAYRAYFRFLLPLVGGLVSKHGEAYSYLPASVDEFPPPADFVRLLEGCGFTDVRHSSMTFGIASLFLARKRGR